MDRLCAQKHRAAVSPGFQAGWRENRHNVYKSSDSEHISS